MASTGTERRQQDRTAVALPATIERVSGRRLTGSATTVDLSEGGACVIAPAAFAVGDVVRIALTAGDVSVEHQGLVVGRAPDSDSKAALNIAFKSLDERTAAGLRRIIDLV